MIISHKNKFIFVKTRKTAGTSLEIALSRICGHNDIITPTYQPDEELRIKCGGQPPQNTIIPFSQYTKKDWYLFVRYRHRACFHEHMPAVEIIKRIGLQTWNDYYTFTIERDPFDKAISLYYWRTKHLTPRPSWTDFLKDRKLSLGLSNYHLYGDDYGVLVNHIIDFRNLKKEITKLEDRFKCSGKLEMPSAKSNIRKDKRPIDEVLNIQEKAYINQICAREIVLLNNNTQDYQLS